MSWLKKIITILFSLVILATAVGVYWANTPIDAGSDSRFFSIRPGGLNSAVRQLSEQQIPVNPWLMQLLFRLTGNGSKLKAGYYELMPDETPWELMSKLVEGRFRRESLTIIEGWTFKQMRQAIANHEGLQHDMKGLSDQDLLQRLGLIHTQAEGLFFPDTYVFARGTPESQIYRQAHDTMNRHLQKLWEKRHPSLPYKTPYEALTMASIVEKETGKASDRDMVAGVFVNRLRIGMRLQTDPTVIYGMGDSYQGKIRKNDLLRDTPYNTYTRAGLPPTPIALPGLASLKAAFEPAETKALYFVARGDGSSQFSDNLADHNTAVDKYIRSQ